MFSIHFTKKTHKCEDVSGKNRYVISSQSLSIVYYKKKFLFVINKNFNKIQPQSGLQVA